MESNEARQKLHKIFGTCIRFNKEFDIHIARLKDGMAHDFLRWCEQAKDGKELGSVPPKSTHKHLYVFFRKIASDVRAVLIKEQNKDFIEVILTGHKQYDDKRIELGYKKSSYYGS